MSRRISASRAACWAVPRKISFSPLALLVICTVPSGVLYASAGIPSICRTVGMAASSEMYLSTYSRMPAAPASGCSTAFTTERIVRSRPPVSVT